MTKIKQNNALHILNLMGCYWPGHEATGPNQSLRAMMHGLSQDANFSVVAKQSPSEQMNANKPTDWEHDGFCETKRLPVNRLTSIGLGKIIRDTPHDILMCNGFFDSQFTINVLIQRRLGNIPKTPLIVSPRGEFAPSALAFGSSRKKAYIKLGKLLGLFKDVWFHGTANHEIDAIKEANLGGAGILTAPNPAKWFPRPEDKKISRNNNTLNLAFLGRITPVKNLPFAIKALNDVTHPVRYHIFGPIADANHWNMCQSLIATLPDHIEVLHKGPLSNDEVPQILANYDALYLPTQGENFGHAIHESLMSGIPVIISDQTPWRDLPSHNAGWDLALNDPRSFSRTIDKLASLSTSEKKKLRDGARAFAEKKWHESGAIDATMAMFKTVLKG